MAYSQYQRIELGFAIDDFAKPIAYSDKEAWVRQIVQLCCIDKGTIPSNPTIGIGIKRYDFLLEEDRYKLQSAINEQIPKFFPDMPFSACQVIVTPDDQDQDIIYLFIQLTTTGDPETVAVAIKKGYNYIDFAISM